MQVITQRFCHNGRVMAVTQVKMLFNEILDVAM